MTVFVAVSITETVLLFMFATYAHDIVGEAPCTVAADDTDELIIRNKIRAVEAKAIVYSSSLSFSYIFLVLTLLIILVLIYPRWIICNYLLNAIETYIIFANSYCLNQIQAKCFFFCLVTLELRFCHFPSNSFIFNNI